MAVPFALMLAMVALMPLFAPHWWERHLPKAAIGLGAVSVLYYLVFRHEAHRLAHAGLDYISFICLIGSLFVVSGGILIRVKGQSTPSKNCLFLALGALAANVIGTTGASVLLIRPWIRSNQYRVTGFHIVFFIFIVSNVAGCLTPIGDPPLFLGYLSKVPFWWTLTHLWQPWLFTVSALIGIFYLFDRHNFLRAPAEIRRVETGDEHWVFRGKRNLVLLGFILIAVFLKSPFREAMMVCAALASLRLTPPQVHEANHFNFAPIREVAWIFLGIFATMIPALHYLEAHAGQLGLEHPEDFFWITGVLSSVLDNAPTYLTFLTASVSTHTDPVDTHRLVVGNARDMVEYLRQDSIQLVAISLGAVFFGACTYIGNGPNFMVKSIAAQAKVHVPGFFGYFLLFALPILIPLYAVVAWLFLMTPDP